MASRPLIQNLHMLDSLFLAAHIPPSWVFHVSIAISAVIVLAYIFLGGLTGAIYNEVLQFFLIVADVRLRGGDVYHGAAAAAAGGESCAGDSAAAWERRHTLMDGLPRCASARFRGRPMASSGMGGEARWAR